MLICRFRLMKGKLLDNNSFGVARCVKSKILGLSHINCNAVGDLYIG